MRSVASFLVPGALLFSACGGSPYMGYKEVEDDVHVRLITLGDGDDLATDSDSIHVRFRVSQLSDAPGSFLSTERWYAAKDLRSGALMPVFRRLHEGDSMSVIAQAGSLPWTVITSGTSDVVADSAHMRTELSLLAIRTPALMRAEEEKRRREDPEGYERRLISAYLSNEPVGWMRWGTSDMHYLITGEALDTNRIVFRESITISWTGVRLEDGQTFDDTRKNGGAFTFRFGDQDQVIRGVEVAVSLLREGQEGRFIFPSSLAFGAKGIPGTLDPWTPVLYTVRIEAVERTR